MNESDTYILMNLRPDLRAIAEVIPVNSTVLDLGCGSGELLAYLIKSKQVMGRGIELTEAGVLACVRRGLSVRQGNLQEGLADYPDLSFDIIILSQTLRYLDDPAMILSEMLRVGRQAIVSFPNWGYWRSRLNFLLRGRIPQAPDQPQTWYEAPRWQAFTVTDFTDFCQQSGFRIRQQIYLSGNRRGHWLSNLLARTAVFVLDKPNNGRPGEE
ncbi:MAG: methionine biosynthesis protein MetW [Candidatus Promineifilaceae bacterium]|nr:methionine biosynthesis protein MetW [Candidatus Promineifilaceae bacterium]